MIRKEIVFLHGRWPTPAVNEIIDAVKFQFSGEAPPQGEGALTIFDVGKVGNRAERCASFEDFQAHRDAWKKSKGMKVEHAAAFGKDPKLEKWMKSKLDAYEHFRFGEEEKAAEAKGADFHPAAFEDEAERRWEEMKMRAKEIEEDVEEGGYFNEQWKAGVDEVFGPWMDVDAFEAKGVYSHHISF